MPEDLNDHDGSLESAMAQMPDIEAVQLQSFEQVRDGVPPKPQPLKPQALQPRDPQNGQWTEHQKRLADEDAARAALAAKPPVEAVDDSAPEEEYFELPAEKEGDQPKRIKADEVWQGYQEREQLRRDLEEAKRGTPPPVEYDRAIYDTVRQRGDLMKMAQQYHAMMQPMQPNADLSNPASPNYNPEQFYRQTQMAREMEQQLHAVRQNMSALEQEQTRDQEALMQARLARERGKVRDIWPEIGRESVARQVRDELDRYYGIDQQTLDTTIDARFYAMAKDALAYRHGLKAQSAAIKVVRSKPRLIKGSARDTANPKQAQRDSAFARLQQSGSLEDAADAIGAIL